jgi:glycosyltransferase 2 family protein
MNHIKKNKSIIIHVLKITIGFFLLFYVISTIPKSDIQALLVNISPLYLLPATILGILMLILQAYRWKILFLSNSISFYTFLNTTCIGHLSNFVMPSSIGGDVVKSISLAKSSKQYSRTISSVIFSRMLGLLSLLLLSFISIWGSPFQTKQLELLPYIYAFIFAMIILGIVFLTNKKSITIPNFFPFIDKLNKLIQSFFSYKGQPKLVLYAFFLSLIIQSMNIMILWFGFLAINSPIDLIDVFHKVPLIIILTMIPVSFFNIGFREIVTINMLTMIPGIEPQHCVGATLFAYVISLLQALFCAVILYLPTKPDTLPQAPPK